MRSIAIATGFSMLLMAAGAASGKDLGPCTEGSAQEKAGAWKGIVEPGVDIPGSSIAKAEQPDVIKRMAVFADLVHQALGEQKGYDAKWYRSAGGEVYKGGPKSYRLNVPLFSYTCDGGRLDLEGEYSGEVSIHANGVWAMSSGEGAIINGKKYQQLGSPIGEIRGFPAFEADTHNTPGGVQITWVVLVSRPGKSPFKYASRRELLDHMAAAADAEWQKGLKTADMITPIRRADVQEKDKQKGLELFLKGAKDEQQKQKWTERYLKDYRTDEQKREEARAKFNKIHDKTRAYLDGLRAKFTPAQLELPALVAANTLYPDEYFKFSPTKLEFCGNRTMCDNTMHGKPFATPDMAYFDPNLPRSAPQFLTVSFTWTDHVVRRNGKYELENPKWEKIRDDFFGRLDFDRLVSMLGK